MALPPWLSSFTAKRKKQVISPDPFDYQQLKQSKPKAVKKAKTVSRVIIDENWMRVAEIAEPISDKPVEEMQAADYRITKVQLGKQTHEVVKHDAQQKVATLVQRYDEVLTKKDQLEVENQRLVAAIQSITQPSSGEGQVPISSRVSEPIQGIERATQKVQDLDT